jgi:O-antigen/teichoic acid export membrane protein
MVLAKIAERLLGLVSTLILVRLLLPADFGLVAMAISVIAIIEILGAFSFDMVLIYRQDATRVHYDTAWTFNVVVATVAAALMLLLAFPTARFYEEPRLVTVIVVLALGSLVQGFSNIGTVDFRKSLQFGKEFRFLLVKKVISFTVTVPLAFTLRNYWALIIGTVASKIAVVIASYVLHHYRPRFSLAAKGELFSFSKWLLLNNLIILARDRSADFAIGRLLGPHDLGLFSVSREIADLPTQQLTAPVNRAVFPGYAKQSHDLAQLRASFTQVTAVLWLLAIPAGTGIALTAPVLVPVALGMNWLEAIPLLGALAVFGTLMVMQANIGYVFYALGAPRTTTMLTLYYVVVLLPLLIVLTMRYGALGAAFAHVVTSAVFIPVSLAVIFRRLALPMTTFMSNVWRTVVAVGVMAVAVRAIVGRTMADGWDPAASLAAAVLTGVVTYVVTLAVLWLASGSPPGPERLFVDKAKGLSLRWPWRSRDALRNALADDARR